MRALLVVVILLAAAVAAPAETLVVQSSRIFTGETIVSGSVVFADGRVVAVVEGPEVPAEARVIDVGHALVTPGLVDLATRTGLRADPAETRPGGPDLVGAVDAMGDGKDLRRAAKREGITTFVVSPGDRAVLGGMLAVVRAPAEDEPPRARPLPAVKAALGTALTFTRGPTSASGADRALDTLLPADVGLWIRCARDEDIRLALGHTDEERALVLLGAPRSEETASRLYAAGVPVVIGPLGFDDSPETLRSPARCRAARVRIGFSSGGAGAEALRRTAALAVRNGLSEIRALRALTTDAAAIAGLDGEAADLVAWSGSPVDLASRPILVVVGGRVVHEEVSADVLAARPLGRPSPREPEPESAVEPDLPIRILAARVVPIDGETIENGTVLVHDGRIMSVGGEEPFDGLTLDLRGAWLLPGLVDASSPIAGNANEQSEEITPDFRVLDEVDADGPGFAAALRDGVTTVYLPPGTRNVVDGRGAVLRTGGRRRVLRAIAELSATLGQDAYSGNRGDLRRRPPDSMLYRRPATRMGVNRALRHFLMSPEGTTGAARLRVLARTERDLRTALRIAEETGVRMILEDAIAAAAVAHPIAAAGFPVVLGTPPHPMRSSRVAEGAEVRLSVAAVLHRAGVPIAFGTRTAGSRVGLREAAILAHRHGLPRAAALEAITLEAARISGVDDRVGSIAPGKDADLVAFSGDPLDPASRVLLVMVEGRIVYDARPKGESR